MKTFQDYTNQDYDKMAQDIISLSKKDESELYKVLGHALYDIGIQASDREDVLFERIDTGTDGISPLKGFNFVAETSPLEENKAEANGKTFWGTFGKKIQKGICESQEIKDIMNGEGTLKDKLVIAIPLILTAIGLSFVLAPVLIVLIAIAIAFIIKAGLQAYCAME